MKLLLVFKGEGNFVLYLCTSSFLKYPTPPLLPLPHSCAHPNLLSALGVAFKALIMLGKYFTTELCPQPPKHL